MSNDFSHVPKFFRDKVERLFDINRQYSEEYCKQLLSLNLYKAMHPTQIIIFKCSDGRLLFSRFAQMPLGFLETFRNLGGKFHYGWLGLNESFKGMIRSGLIEYLERKRIQIFDERLRKQQQEFLDGFKLSTYFNADHGAILEGESDFATLAIVTYHFSEGDNETRGCKASGFNILQSIKDAKGFRMSLEKAHKGSLHKVFSIVIGLETDEDRIVIHGENGQVKDLGTIAQNASDYELFGLICKFYPSMPLQMKLDFLPVLSGNIQHIAKVRGSNRPIEEMTHQEWVLGICNSKAVESVTVPNTGVFVGLSHPVLSKAIRTGLDVIKPNISKGVLLLTAACYGGDDTESSARLQAKYYKRLGLEVANKHWSAQPELINNLYPLPLLVNNETKLFEMLRPRKNFF